jgi:glycosidase
MHTVPDSPLDLDSFGQSARRRLALLYGEERASAVLDDLLARMRAHPRAEAEEPSARWTQSDVVLISYADSILRDGEAPLATLARFLEEQLASSLNTVHLLPFYPYSSDGGFSVIDYEAVDPAHGDWSDVDRIRDRFDLMMDLVMNHCSSQSRWFQNFLAGEGEGQDFFHVLPGDTDVSQVVRPRTHSLLQAYKTAEGEKQVWATFSRDQLDLNYGNPAVLLAMIHVMLSYVERGARFLRLDAVAFLWKRLGSSCIHLEETHQVVKLMREVLAAVAPEVILLTETNVPNEENLSYFGRGDEAHMVYQFSLPPLLLHALWRGNAEKLSAWAASLDEPPAGCTYFNFTASHDGVGLRPVEGLLPDSEVERLVAGMQASGGFVSFRTVDGGNARPYEINISLYYAMSNTARGRDRMQVARFIACQTAMIGLRGIPGVYIHSLTATANDHAGYDRSGHPRDINRHRWDEARLMSLLRRPRTKNARVFNELRRRLALRRWQPAFHPDAPMRVLDLGPEIFAFERTSLDGLQRIVAVHNFGAQARPLTLDAEALSGVPRYCVDLLSGTQLTSDQGGVTLFPYQSLWLAGPAAG